MFPYFTILSHDHCFIVGCIIIVKLYYTFIVGHKHLHFILLSDLDCIKSILKHLLLHKNILDPKQHKTVSPALLTFQLFVHPQ